MYEIVFIVSLGFGALAALTVAYWADIEDCMAQHRAGERIRPESGSQVVSYTCFRLILPLLVGLRFLGKLRAGNTPDLQERAED